MWIKNIGTLAVAIIFSNNVIEFSIAAETCLAYPHQARAGFSIGSCFLCCFLWCFTLQCLYFAG